ncbi:UNVERIFIED_CONTAM: hypothetical protein NCL1_49761 [Trichonephila clavipes]
MLPKELYEENYEAINVALRLDKKTQGNYQRKFDKSLKVGKNPKIGKRKKYYYYENGEKLFKVRDMTMKDARCLQSYLCLL